MRHEDTTAYVLWDLLITACVTFTAVELPLQLVLGYEAPAAWRHLDGVITLLFVLDIVVHFRRPAIIRSKIVRDPRLLARHYTRRWLIIDLLAAVPFRLLPVFSPWKLLRLAKLIRVAYLMRQWQQSNIERAHYLRLAYFAFWLGLTAHWLACGWLALGGIVGESDLLTRYTRALYWSITTLTTVGYGDVTPQTNAQMVYTMAVMILGVGMYGYVIGNVATLLANIDRAKALYLSNMERLSTFLNYRNVPPNLQRRIYDYYTYLWENRLGYDESAILSELPASLRTEVSLVLKRDFIKKVPFFQKASQELIRDIALALRPVVFTPGDYIFRAGDIGRQMYFISQGTVEVIAADGQSVLTTLTDGDFFGEIALLHSQPRTASVRAMDYCDLYALDKDTFARIVAHYPYFATHVQDMARRRQDRGK
jgi:hypothetical protein